MPDREATPAVPDEVELTDAGGDPPCWAHLGDASGGTAALPITDELLRRDHTCRR